MRWPFVARDLYDAALADLRVEREKNAGLVERLLDRFEDVRVRPASVRSSAPVLDEYDPMKALIAERCGSNMAKRSIMLRQLALDRADNMNEGDIRAAIENGVGSHGVPG